MTSINHSDSGFSSGDATMQIHRFDNVSSTGTPRPVIAAGSGATDPQGAAARENMAEGVGGGELEFLTRQLDGISEVRPEVVAAAKMRMQRGDYLSRAAAEQTAAVILSKDA
jgi:hypothetical protein